MKARRTPIVKPSVQKADTALDEQKDILPRWYTDEERQGYSCDLQFVYGLVDPTVLAKNRSQVFLHGELFCKGELFYIGRTKSLLERFNQHVKGYNDGSEKDERIRMITRSGYLPIMVTIHQACSEQEAIFRESFYINYYMAAGFPLTNATLVLNNKGKQGRYAYFVDQWTKQYYRRSNFLRRWIDRLLKRDDFAVRYLSLYGSEEGM